MKKLLSIMLPVLTVALMPSLAIAGDLKSNDFVGVSFWIISIAMVAATVFFLVERDRVNAKWKTSLTVSALVTLIAAVHYFYMRDVWVETGQTPTVFRYIDWLLTVPLLMIEFYFILAAVTAVSVGVFLETILRNNCHASWWLSRRSRHDICNAWLHHRDGWMVIHSI